MLFLVIAKDGQDPAAPQRRQAVREQHLLGSKEARAKGLLQVAGALLNDNGGMVGSALIIEAESRAELDSYLQSDIYSKANVWQSFEVYPFKRAF